MRLRTVRDLCHTRKVAGCDWRRSLVVDAPPLARGVPCVLPSGARRLIVVRHGTACTRHDTGLGLWGRGPCVRAWLGWWGGGLRLWRTHRIERRRTLRVRGWLVCTSSTPGCCRSAGVWYGRGRVLMGVAPSPLDRSHHRGRGLGLASAGVGRFDAGLFAALVVAFLLLFAPRAAVLGAV